MIRTRYLILCLGLLCLGGPVLGSPDADPPVTVLRLCVLDVSGSMGNGRLASAIGELREMARQLPPSVTAPFVVVPFTGSPGQVRCFTDLVGLEGYLTGLASGGSTSIAQGLAKGIEELGRYRNARHVALVLVSDGEDTDRAAILTQEQKLDSLFRHRHEKGLRNTVFAKRWEGALAELITRLKKSGSAHVIDAGPGRLYSLTLIPSIQVTSARWASRASRAVIDLSIGIEVRGGIRPARLGVISVTCRTPGAMGDTQIAVDPQSTSPRTARIEVTVPPLLESGGEGQLTFSLEPPLDLKLRDGVVLPLLSRETFNVTYRLPPRVVRVNFAAEIRHAGPPVWRDAAGKLASYAVVVQVSLTTDSRNTWSGDIDCRIECGPGLTVEEGDPEFAFRKPGTVSRTLCVSSMREPAAKEMEGLLMVFASTSADGIEIQPGHVELSMSMPLPRPLETRLTARLERIVKVEWVDVAASRVRFEGDIELNIDGPLAADTRIVVRAPSSVTTVALVPDVVHSGKQRVVVIGECVVRAGDLNSLEFGLTEFAPSPTVNLRIEGPLVVEVQAPAPVQLALARGAWVPPTFEALLPCGQESGVLELSLVPVGAVPPGSLDGVQVRLDLSGPFLLDEIGGVVPGGCVGLTLLDRGGVRSYFRDTEIEGLVAVIPDSNSGSLLGSRQRVRLILEAPFKIVLLGITFAIVLGLTSLLVLRLYTTMTQELEGE